MRVLNTFNDAVSAAQKTGATVYTIGLGNGFDINQPELQQIAKQTNGKFYLTPNASDLKNLYQEISVSTQEEYVITYKSPRPTYDGTRRKIEINVGNITGQGKYTESHLINIESNVWVGLIYLLPLMGLVVIPPLVKTVKQTLFPQKPPKAIPMPTSSSSPNNIPHASGFPEVKQQSTGIVRTCPKCGHLLNPGARFCPACGNPSPPVEQFKAGPAQPAQVHYCRQCGKELRPGARFCLSCGTRISS